MRTITLSFRDGEMQRFGWRRSDTLYHQVKGVARVFVSCQHEKDLGTRSV
jgi:hypothetical protein